MNNSIGGKRRGVKFVLQSYDMKGRPDTYKVYAVGVPRLCEQCRERLAAPNEWIAGGALILSARKLYLLPFKHEEERDEYYSSRSAECSDMTKVEAIMNKGCNEVQLLYGE